MKKKFRVIWTPQAQNDLVSINHYIARDSPTAAKRFVQRIRDRGRRIAVMPKAGARVLESSDPDVRETYLGAYRIIYRVVKNEVQILTVIHGARLLTDDYFQEGQP